MEQPEKMIWRKKPSILAVLPVWILYGLVGNLIIKFTGPMPIIGPFIPYDLPAWAYNLSASSLIHAFLLSVPAWQTLSLLCITYELTNYRVRIWKGVFTRHAHQVELHRLRDQGYIKPFHLRILRLANCYIVSRDPTVPAFWLKGMRQPEKVVDSVRAAAENNKKMRGFKEFEVTGAV